MNVMFSYFYKELDKEETFPLRFGLSFQSLYNITWMLGYYNSSLSAGLQYQYKALILNYISYHDTSENIFSGKEHRRHGVGLHFKW